MNVVRYSDGTTDGLVVARRNPMSGILTRFRIEALHGQHTIDIPIHDDRLILIGENGAGKSTVANFIYFFLTNQWHRMLAYDFKSIQVTVGSNEIEVPKEKLLANNKNKQTSYTGTRRIGTSTITAAVMPVLLSAELSPSLSEWVEELSREITHTPNAATFHSILGQLSAGLEILPDDLAASAQLLKDSFGEKVLYLPTYRRVEQELAAIFPELARSSGFRESMERWKRRTQTSRYVELVQFGMQDVEDTFKHKMDELSDSLRDGLNKLTGTYLRDVIQGAYKSVASDEIGELDESAIDTIFSRIDQSVLPEQEQQKVRSIVSKIRMDSKIQDEDQVVVQFLTRLIELHKHQQQKEKDVREFVGVCNQYLQNKVLVYDNKSFDISLVLDYAFDQEVEGEKSNVLKMNMLSSGEKQIVSLFSQLYLSDSAKYFAIIDEPELSLSVFWQKRLLPDILNSGRCSGLIAVTHSPFICESPLVEKYTYPLERFMESLK